MEPVDGDKIKNLIQIEREDLTEPCFIINQIIDAIDAGEFDASPDQIRNAVIDEVLEILAKNKIVYSNNSVGLHSVIDEIESLKRESGVE